MGCFSKPKKQTATKSETLLAQTARDQYQYYKRTIVPLENAEIADTKRIDTPGEKLRSEERAVNAAREGFTPGPVSPQSANNVLQLNLAKANAKAGASGAGKTTNKARSLEKRTNIVSLGRGLSTSASGVGQRSASFAAGNQSAELSAQNHVAGAKLQLAGQIAGTAAGYYGDKSGWFSKNKPKDDWANRAFAAGVS